MKMRLHRAEFYAVKIECPETSQFSFIDNDDDVHSLRSVWGRARARVYICCCVWERVEKQRLVAAKKQRHHFSTKFDNLAEVKQLYIMDDL